MNPTLRGGLIVLLLHVAQSGQAQLGPDCAATLSEMKAMVGDPAFPLRWQETSMQDGKPLVVSISERNNALVLEFFKTREGIWAESVSAICKTNSGLEARFESGQIRLGPAANWGLRLALEKGGKFSLTRLGPEELRIATSGWSGRFSAKAP